MSRRLLGESDEEEDGREPAHFAGTILSGLAPGCCVEVSTRSRGSITGEVVTTTPLVIAPFGWCGDTLELLPRDVSAVSCVYLSFAKLQQVKRRQIIARREHGR